MNYAVIVCFDEKCESQIMKFTTALVENGINRYLIDNEIPPHVTIAAFSSDNSEVAKSIISKNINRFKSGRVVWCSIGAFNPNVLFITPLMNQYLYELNYECNSLFEENAQFELSSNYAPFSWVPHTTVAIDLNSEELNRSFSILQQEFKPFAGVSQKILLVQSKPFNIIAEWNLD